MDSVCSLPSFRYQMDLDDQLEAYRSNIMHKCNMAYHVMVNTCEKKSLWNEEYMPQYFYKTREILALTISPIQAFVETSGYVEVTKEFNDFVSWSDFAVALNDFCRERAFHPQRWTPQFCKPAFLRFGIVDDGRKIHGVRFTADYRNKQGKSISRSFSAPSVYDPETSC